MRLSNRCARACLRGSVSAQGAGQLFGLFLIPTPMASLRRLWGYVVMGGALACRASFLTRAPPVTFQRAHSRGAQLFGRPAVLETHTLRY